LVDTFVLVEATSGVDEEGRRFGAR